MTPQETMDRAYYLAQDTRKQTLYNGFAYAPNSGVSQQLTQDERNKLVDSLIQQGVTIDEQIDFWGWDAWTTMNQRLMYGILWVSPGMGNVQSTQVITPGMFSGPPPSGAIITTTDPAKYVPFEQPETPVKPVVTDLVGPYEIGPYYGVIPGDASPVGTVTTDSRGTFKKVKMPDPFAIGGGFIEYWMMQ